MSIFSCLSCRAGAISPGPEAHRGGPVVAKEAWVVGLAAGEEQRRTVDVIDGPSSGAPMEPASSGSSGSGSIAREMRVARRAFVEHRRLPDGGWIRQSSTSPSGWEIS